MQDNLDHMGEKKVILREVIRPPLWILAFIYLMFLSLVVAVWAAFDNRAAIFTGIAVTVLLIFIALAMKSEITIDSQEIHIGKANIELKYLDSVEVLTPAQMQLLRTRDADPAAYLGIKFWISTGVKITLKDPRDPTPYLLISSKKSEELTNTLYKLL